MLRPTKQVLFSGALVAGMVVAAVIPALPARAGMVSALGISTTRQVEPLDAPEPWYAGDAIEQETADLTLPNHAEFAAPTQLFMAEMQATHRPQVPMLGVALEDYTDKSGFSRALELNVRFGHRWRSVHWSEVEPKEGEYHWEVLADLERDLELGKSLNLESFLAIQLAPSWAQKTPPYACGQIRDDKLDEFADFVVEVIKRYGTKSQYGVRYWQLFNEPDITRDIAFAPDAIFGCWGDMGDDYYGGGVYAQMLKVVYPRIKAVDPKAIVVMGGLLLECDPYTMSVPDTCVSQNRLKSGLYLEGIMKAGGGKYFDIIDLHSYGNLNPNAPSKMSSIYAWSPTGTGLPEKVKFVRTVLAKYGWGAKPVMTSEVALKCEQDGDLCRDVGAAFIPRVYAEAYNLGLTGAIYHAMISEYKYKGLLHEDASPKPQFNAYRWLGSQLTNAKYRGAITHLTGVSGAAWNRPADRLWIVWSSDGTDKVIALPTGFMQAFDKYGNVIEPVDDQLTLNWSPIYIEVSY